MDVLGIDFRFPVYYELFLLRSFSRVQNFKVTMYSAYRYNIPYPKVLIIDNSTCSELEILNVRSTPITYPI